MDKTKRLLMKTFKLNRCYKNRDCKCVNQLTKLMLAIPLNDNDKKNIDKKILTENINYDRCFNQNN